MPELIAPQLLEILRCPADHSKLSLAEEAIVSLVNGKIAGRALTNVGGQKLEKPIDGGLIRAAGDRLYPIIGGIPVMIVDEAIDISKLA